MHRGAGRSSSGCDDDEDDDDDVVVARVRLLTLVGNR